jgi:phosphohistidine phosphatase SixA
MKCTVPLALFVALLVSAISANAQMLSGEALVAALRQGGYVLVIRHASAPREPPDKAAANADNLTLERQLDENGRTTATAMGAALRELNIPVGDVFTSPTYRALETVRLARLPNPRTQEELGDGGQSMQGITDAQAAWLRNTVRQLPRGTNTVVVTHLPNVSRAFPQWATGLSDGETLVFGPDGKGGVTVVARIPIGQWPQMRR